MQKEASLSSYVPDVVAGDGPALLTPRETEVLRLICAGKSTKEIADDLGISFKTAVSHRTHILRKAGAHESITLFRWAIAQGIVEAPRVKVAIPLGDNGDSENGDKTLRNNTLRVYPAPPA